MSRRKKQGPGEGIVRPILPTDAAAVYTIAANPQAARFTDQLPGLEDWLSGPEKGQYRFVSEIDGSTIGLVWIQCRTRPRINHIGDLSLIVRPDFWGQGIGTCLARTVLDLADNWLNLKRLQANVLVGNEAAFGLLEKFGFETEGIHRQSLFVDGQLQDEVHLSRL